MWCSSGQRAYAGAGIHTSCVSARKLGVSLSCLSAGSGACAFSSSRVEGVNGAGAFRCWTTGRRNQNSAQKTRRRLSQCGAICVLTAHKRATTIRIARLVSYRRVLLASPALLQRSDSCESQGHSLPKLCSCRTRKQQAVRDRQPGAPPPHRGALAPQATAEPELAARGAAPDVGARGEAVAGRD